MKKGLFRRSIKGIEAQVIPECSTGCSKRLDITPSIPGASWRAWGGVGCNKAFFNIC